MRAFPIVLVAFLPVALVHDAFAGAPARPVSPAARAVRGSVKAGPGAKPMTARSFSLTTGENQSQFVQTGELTVHTLVRTSSAPRVVFATPAGNSSESSGSWVE